MTGDINLQAQARAWLTHSVLQPHVSRYAEHLDRGRYAPNTQRVYLCCVAHFALWLTPAVLPHPRAAYHRNAAPCQGQSVGLRQHHHVVQHVRQLRCDRLDDGQ
jgi:hypothetical protein